MLNMLLNGVLFLLIAVLARIVIRQRKAIKEAEVGEFPELTPSFIKEALTCRYYYEENSDQYGWSSGKTMMINRFYNNKIEIASTVVHEYVHLWQNQQKFIIIESIKHGICEMFNRESLLEQHAYIIEDIFKCCIKNNKEFKKEIIPEIWYELKNNSFDSACIKAGKIMREYNQI